jgi:hypothetical protein
MKRGKKIGGKCKKKKEERGKQRRKGAVLWSWSRKEPKLLAGTGILKFRLRLPTPGQTKVQ